MTFLDKFLQNVRFSKVRRFITHDCKILDIGCENGELYHYLGKNVKQYVGMDLQTKPKNENYFRIVKGPFPGNVPSDVKDFDAIVMLAVVEHLDEKSLSNLNRACSNILKPGGLLLMTVPSPVVDKLLIVLRSLKLVHAETLHEHHGFLPGEVKKIISNDHFDLVCQQKFELGLNNFFVFCKK